MQSVPTFSKNTTSRIYRFPKNILFETVSHFLDFEKYLGVSHVEYNWFRESWARLIIRQSQKSWVFGVSQNESEKLLVQVKQNNSTELLGPGGVRVRGGEGGRIGVGLGGGIPFIGII